MEVVEEERIPEEWDQGEEEVRWWVAEVLGYLKDALCSSWTVI